MPEEISVRLALAALAAWRLTHLFVAEDGPFDLVLRLRARLGDSFAGRAMDCFYCLSLWIAAPLALIVTRDPLAWLIVWLAVSGAASLLEQATTRQKDDPHELLWRPPPLPDPPPAAPSPAPRAADADGPRPPDVVG